MEFEIFKDNRKNGATGDILKLLEPDMKQLPGEKKFSYSDLSY